MCPEERSHNTSPLFCFLERRRFFFLHHDVLRLSGSDSARPCSGAPQTMSQINPYSLQADCFGSCVIGMER